MKCEGSEYNTYFAFSIIILIVYVIGLPVLNTFLLVKKRRAIMSGTTIIELRFIYQGYKFNALWW